MRVTMILRRVRTLARGAALGGLAVLLLAPPGQAANIAAACPAAPFGTLNVRDLGFQPGDVVTVSGVCTGNLVIPADVSGLTFDGQGTATTTAADPTLPVWVVSGTAITIKGFTISGGGIGVLVQNGGTATIDGNTISSVGTGVGVQVQRQASATILNNTIENNAGSGILVQESAAARIGIAGGQDTTASPNTIRNNGAGGIIVTRSSHARIVGNTIVNNTGTEVAGIYVLRGSQADIASNDISGNGGNGIGVGQLSGVHLGADTGTSIVASPNTTAAPNGGFGVGCFTNGYLDGRVGTLAGTSGNVDLVNGCVESLADFP